MPRKRGKRWVASGYDKASKKKAHLGTFDTKGEALRVEIEHKLRNAPVGRESCDQFAARWVRDYPRPRDTTDIHNAERVRKFGKDFKGIRLAAVDRPTARMWAMRNKSHYPAVRAMFGDAMRDGLVDQNPFADLRIPKGPGRRGLVALTETEFDNLADVALDPRMELGDFAPQYRGMILFSGYVGLRPGELFALRADDVGGNVVHIERALSSKTRKIGKTKNGKDRTVAIPPAAIAALMDVPPHDNGLLFCTPAGRMWTQPSNHRYWSRLRLLADRPGMDWYEMRHMAATFLLERGATPADVAQQLGHTDGGRLVQEVYGHPADAGARARIMDLWGETTPPPPINFPKHVENKLPQSKT